jgi:hypothetical protein
MPDDQRPRLDDILNGRDGNFKKMWDSTPPAAEFELLPPGRYRALVADGRLAESKVNKTLSYKVSFQILEPLAHAGRKVFHDCWMTPKALAASKRDLAKLKINTDDQLRRPPPGTFIAELRVVLDTEDDGTQRNKVFSFKVVGEGISPAALQPEKARPGQHTAAQGDTTDDDPDDDIPF